MRALGVDIKWLAELNTPSEKERTNPEEFGKIGFYGEGVINKCRGICQKELYITPKRLVWARFSRKSGARHESKV
jgi:hypothetical protein